MSGLREDSAEEAALADAIAEYFELQRQGKPPSISSFARGYPGIEGPLRTCLGVLGAIPAEAATVSEDPRVLGDFKIIRLLGRGGMGVVYEALQQSLPRTVALKVLAPGGMEDATRLVRFRREIEATARLRHPNIVPIYEAGQAAGMPYYAMPLLQGQSLDGWLGAAREDPARSPLATRETLVAWIARFIEVARALSDAHAAGILHRDIKPSNLFLELDGRLLILDFGLARSTLESGASLSGGPVGTPRYMSPEQILVRKHEVDGRTDLFSLAATLYEVLTLRPAFPGEDRETIFRAILSEDPEPPRRIDPRVPRDLEVVLLKALEKEAARRYRDLREFADDLQRFLDYEPVRARPVGRFGRLGRRAQRNPLAAGAMLLAAALLVLLPAYPLVQWARDRRAVSRLLEQGSALLAASDAEGARDVAVRLESLAPGNAAAMNLKQAALAALREKADQAAREEAERRSEGEIALARVAGARLAELRERRTLLARELDALELRVPPWAQLSEKSSLLELRKESQLAREQRDQSFREAHSHLLSALQLVPGSKAARRELAALAFEEFLDAERARERGRMESLRALVEAYDDGELRERWAGAGSLAIETEPAGALVYLFRHEERDLRLLPVPFSFDHGSDQAWLEAQPVRGPWVVLRLDSVDTPDSGFEVGDELVSICGNPPPSSQWAIRHLMFPHRNSSAESHEVFVRRKGEPLSIALEPRTTLKIGGEVLLQPAYVLRCDASNLAGQTPLAAQPIAMGSYLALLHRDGFVDVRVPLVIDRQEHERLRVELRTAEQIGGGFVYVPAGPVVLGGDAEALSSFALEVREVPGYCMQRSEVSFREYFEFIADLERTDPEAAQARAPRGPLTSAAHDPFWKLDAAGRIQPVLPGDWDGTYPACGISFRDAKAYCAWLNSKTPDPNAVFDLPREDEWEKAARGVDGRLFTWGNTLEWTFARMGPSSKTAGPLPRDLYATDESVYGIRDLNGNVREWCSGSEKAFGRRMRGAAWGSVVAGNCHLACRIDEKEPEFVDLGTGFRVVKRFKK